VLSWSTQMLNEDLLILRGWNKSWHARYSLRYSTTRKTAICDEQIAVLVLNGKVKEKGSGLTTKLLSFFIFSAYYMVRPV
jgi:hypothetical protein